jgi:hypothetical protein
MKRMQWPIMIGHASLVNDSWIVGYSELIVGHAARSRLVGQAGRIHLLPNRHIGFETNVSALVRFVCAIWPHADFLYRLGDAIMMAHDLSETINRLRPPF